MQKMNTVNEVLNVCIQNTYSKWTNRHIKKSTLNETQFKLF